MEFCKLGNTMCKEIFSKGDAHFTVRYERARFVYLNVQWSVWSLKIPKRRGSRSFEKLENDASFWLGRHNFFLNFSPADVFLLFSQNHRAFARNECKYGRRTMVGEDIRSMRSSFPLLLSIFLQFSFSSSLLFLLLFPLAFHSFRDNRQIRRLLLRTRRSRQGKATSRFFPISSF